MLCHHMWMLLAAARASPALMRSPAVFAQAAAALKRRRAELAAAQPQQRPAAPSSRGAQSQQAISKHPTSAHTPQTPQLHLAEIVQPDNAAALGAVTAAQSGASSKARDSEAAEPKQAAGAENMSAVVVSGTSNRPLDSAAGSQLQQPGVKTRSSARAHAVTIAAEVPCSTEADGHRGVNDSDHLPQPAADQSSEKASTLQYSSLQHARAS